MIDSWIARDRSLAGFGRPGLDPRVGAYTTAESGHRVGGFSVQDCPDPGLVSWSTVGASFLDGGIRSGSGTPVTVEFVGCACAEWGRFGTALAFCAFFVADGGSAAYGAVIRDAFRHLDREVSAPHAFVVAPFSWEREFPAYEDDDVSVVWIQIVPITEAEAAFAERHGGDALESVFLDRQPDLYDLGRPSLR